jgi:hypothetical protein
MDLIELEKMINSMYEKVGKDSNSKALQKMFKSS